MIVGLDGHIDITAPELQPGQRVTVIIAPETAAQTANAYLPEGDIPMIDLIEEDSGQRLFKTVDEVDEYLRQERDSWNR